LATVYSTTPGTTSPSIELRAFANFWGAPVDDPALGPPDVGSSAQWNFVQAPTTWAKSSNTRIPLPVQLTYIHTLILALREDQRVNVGQLDRERNTGVARLRPSGRSLHEVPLSRRSHIGRTEGRVVDGRAPEVRKSAQLDRRRRGARGG